MSQIRVENLKKTYRVAERKAGLKGAFAGLLRRRHRVIEALAGINFELETGELVGYIGPNGAGKSTTVKIMAGILVPDSGTCVINGFVPWQERKQFVAGIGVVFGQRTQLWWDLPVIESFELLSEIYLVRADEYRKRLGDLEGLLDLGSLMDTPVRQLSLGQRMRCDLAASLLHNPPILFLDEPTIGLDAVSKLAVRDFVKRLNREEGTTIILTTHDMDDIEALCRRIIVIGSGHILSDGTLSQLRDRVTRERWLIVDLDAEQPPPEIPETRLVRHDGHRVVYGFDPSTLPAADLIAAVSARTSVRDIFVENPPIEQIVARLYGEQTP
jgi:ABC-2 type transport system ATP-binding protein